MNNSEEDMMNDPFETPLTETLQEPQEPPMPDQTYDTGDMNQVNESTESENLIPVGFPIMMSFWERKERSVNFYYMLPHILCW